MSHEVLTMGWVGAPLTELHLKPLLDRQQFPLLEPGAKVPLDGNLYEQEIKSLEARGGDWRFGGNSYNAAVACAADTEHRFDVHVLWGKGENEAADAIEEDMIRRGITSHAVKSPHHINGGSVIGQLDGDRVIFTKHRTPLEETLHPEDVRNFLRIPNLGALGLSSLKSNAANNVIYELLRESDEERKSPIFTIHNPGSGEFGPELQGTLDIRTLGAFIANRGECNDFRGKDLSASEHAVLGLENALFSIVSDGIDPLHVAFRSGVLQDHRLSGSIKVEIPRVPNVVDTTGAGDRLSSAFLRRLALMHATGRFTLAGVREAALTAVKQSGQVIQYKGGHADIPYPVAA